MPWEPCPGQNSRQKNPRQNKQTTKQTTNRQQTDDKQATNGRQTEPSNTAKSLILRTTNRQTADDKQTTTRQQPDNNPTTTRQPPNNKQDLPEQGHRPARAEAHQAHTDNFTLYRLGNPVPVGSFRKCTATASLHIQAHSHYQYYLLTYLHSTKCLHKMPPRNASTNAHEAGLNFRVYGLGFRVQDL